MVRTTASYNNLYYDSQTSKARQMFDFDVQFLLLSWATGSVSSGILSAFDVIKLQSWTKVCAKQKLSIGILP